MRSESKGKNVIIGFLCVAIAMMSVGFAALSSNLNVVGTAKVKTSTWDVHFENVSNKATIGAPTITSEPTIDSITTTVNYEVTLNKPGDAYLFTVDVVNNGSIDAKLNSFVFGGVSTEQDVYINYSVTGMTDGEVLVAGAKKTITVSVEYDANITGGQLPTSDQTLNLTASLNFGQDK